MLILKCKNPECKKVWTYKGKRRFYTTCPDCKSSVKIPKYNNPLDKGD